VKPIVIIATGYTINDISNSEWYTLCSRCHTIGLNGSVMVPYQFDDYVFVDTGWILGANADLERRPWVKKVRESVHVAIDMYTKSTFFFKQMNGVTPVKNNENIRFFHGQDQDPVNGVLSAGTLCAALHIAMKRGSHKTPIFIFGADRTLGPNGELHFYEDKVLQEYNNLGQIATGYSTHDYAIKHLVNANRAIPVYRCSDNNKLSMFNNMNKKQIFEQINNHLKHNV